MPESVHRTSRPKAPRSLGFSLLAARAGGPLWRPLRPAARRLRYAIPVLLAWVTVLTLHAAVGDVFGMGVPGAASETSRAIDSFLTNVIALAPAVVLVSLMGEIFPDRPRARLFWMALAVVSSTGVGVIVGDIVLQGADAEWLLANPRDVAEATIALLFPAGLLVAAYELHRQGVDAADAAFRAHADRISMQAEISKARLQLLHAQIEPHFIFNSLAHVRRLYQIDVAAARKMLDSLVRYFVGALPSLRQETCSLAEELTLIDAYLAIHRLRMLSRLEYEVDFPEALLSQQVPTMILLTLVENAIKHGVSPLPQGGFVRVSAEATDSALELHVADSGRGMSVSSGSGTGLSNIRARLVALYGDTASLNLTINKPSGIIATVRMPWRP
jgi:hypothetical protein